MGDEKHLPGLSDSMRKVIELFSGLMKDVVQKEPVDEEKYTPYLDGILRKEEFRMTTRQLLKQEGLLEGMQKGRQEARQEIELIVTGLNEGKPLEMVAEDNGIPIELVLKWKELLKLQ